MESGLFLVGSASLAISVSGRAERRGGEAAAAAAAAALEGDGLFLLCNLPADSPSHFDIVLFCFLSSPSTPHRFQLPHKRNSSWSQRSWIQFRVHFFSFFFFFVDLEYLFFVCLKQYMYISGPRRL